MRTNYIYKSFLLLALTGILSCKNNSKAPEQVPAELKMVNVPSVISDPAQVNKYVADHFWDGVDFGDSLLMNNIPALNRHYSIYLNHIQQCPIEVAEQSVKKFTAAYLKGNNLVKNYLVDLTEKALHDPNSQDRNEDIYIWVLEMFSADENMDDLLREKYKNQLTMSLKNRPGEIATDFSFLTSKGKQSRLHTTKGQYTLLFFYDPDCHSCEYALEYIKESSVIDSFGAKITKLAVYTGEDAEKWLSTSGKFTPEWIVAFNNDFTIERERLYDRRATPYIFLLDNNKRVLVKDATPADLEFYLKNF
ncbi:MAG: hypothetical protein CVU12_06130 [Bacteroidetes bacterium HGW-Bacteroidetes-7]|jgi:hypothetical protein|nr:MAG: hypothetical protein CVU12_06130 [Bacteroidetes bacterium HGW-Bacteroidetes-7]